MLVVMMMTIPMFFVCESSSSAFSFCSIYGQPLFGGKLADLDRLSRVYIIRMHG